MATQKPISRDPSKAHADQALRAKDGPEEDGKRDVESLNEWFRPKRGDPSQAKMSEHQAAKDQSAPIASSAGLVTLRQPFGHR